MLRNTIFGFCIALISLAGCKNDNNKSTTTADNKSSSLHVHTVAPGTPLKLAVVSNNANDFWSYCRAGCKKFEKETGIKVEFKMPTNGTVAEQKQIFEDLLTQGYNGISASIPAPDSQTPDVNAATKETNFICMDSDAPKSDRLMFIGTDNFEGGKSLGKEIVKMLPNGGKIAVFVGTFSADNAQKRLAGVEAALKEGEGAGKHYEIVAKKEDNVDHGKARTNVEDVINANPDVKLMCGLWAYNGPAIASAIEAAGKKGVILAACFDEDEGTLDGIQKGVVGCTVVQKPFQFGYLSCQYLRDIAYKGESAIPKSRIVDTGVEVINSANVEEFRKRLAEMKK